jgi:hypothetical protein
MVKANSTSLRKFNLAATNLKKRRDLDLYDAWIHRLHRINYEKTMFRQSLEYLIRFLLMKEDKNILLSKISFFEAKTTNCTLGTHLLQMQGSTLPEFYLWQEI